MPNNKGQIVKGERIGRATEFKPGQHWRPRKPWWDRAWLVNEYVTHKRSAGDIAREYGVTDSAIQFWLRKHGIQARDVSAARAVKHWGVEGESNPMHGKRGILNPNWKGGLTPLRQEIYAKSEWKAFAKAVRKRDKACRLCGGSKDLHIHHIDPFSQAPLLVMDMGNVILLCKVCHQKMQGKERRWKRKLFNILETERRETVQRARRP